MHFLIEYHRPSGALLSLIEYKDGHEAMAHRFELERSKDPDVEVIVLTAKSLDTLRQTHSRYFTGI